MAMRAAANQHGMVQRFGRIQTLEVDTSARSLQFSVLLKGESEAISGSASYLLVEHDGLKFIEVHCISLSREWLQQILILLQEQKGPFRFPLQGFIGKLLAMIL